MGQRKLCFPAGPLSRKSETKSQKPRAAVQRSKSSAFACAFELSLARFLRLEKSPMVRQVILGEQAEVTADDDRTLLEKASTVLMEAVHASSASPGGTA